MIDYINRNLLALDQWLNALLGGYADETISFRASIAQAEGRKWGCVFCKIIERWWPRHCDLSLPSKSQLLSRGATYQIPQSGKQLPTGSKLT